MEDKDASKLSIGMEVTFEEVGVTDDDVELIVKYSRGDDDHNLLDVESIEELI